jgi:hypothetical protein
VLLIGLAPALIQADNTIGPPGMNPPPGPQAESPTLVVRFVHINGGGGESSDGTFSIRGTLGQPAAGDADSCRESITSEQWSTSSETDPGRIWDSSFELAPACK